MKMNRAKIFNLFDTNGRRADIIFAMRDYLSILSDLYSNGDSMWKPIPDSLNQFLFYQQAILSSDFVFKKHPKFDKLLEIINNDPKLKKAFADKNLESVNECYLSNKEFNNKLSDAGCEDRARHYTSNLVKMGFATKDRKITEVGEQLLGKCDLQKDILEQYFPVQKENIIYLRQLLKLRVYNDEGTKYYCPFAYAIYILLLYGRIDQNVFFEMVQGMSPDISINDIFDYTRNYKLGDITKIIDFDFPEELDTNYKCDEEIFREYFYNKKSNAQELVYYNFYLLLFKFNNEKTKNNLKELLDFYYEKRIIINKAFSFNINLFKRYDLDNIIVDDFVNENIELFNGNIIEILYKKFYFSKYMDTLHEYSDTTERIFKASGIISFKNGFVEFAYKEIVNKIFDIDNIKKMIFSDTMIESMEVYESNGNFVKNLTLCEILNYNDALINSLVDCISSEFPQNNKEEIKNIFKFKRRMEFEQYIETEYPIDRVIDLMKLFVDRCDINDKKLNDSVSTSANIPTIYEYLVGIAWYYLSDKTIDLLDSFNLILSADFEPINFASGGKADIVIINKENLVVLEMTLMDKNSQKKSEFEPVLRHSIIACNENQTSNIKTFFISNEFDDITITTWRSVYNVPYSDYANKIIIMPIKTEELISLLNNNINYGYFLSDIKKFFEKDVSNFVLERDKFINKYININT